MGQGEPSPADVEKDDGEDERDGSEETGEGDGEDDQVGSPTVKAACPSAGSPRGLGIPHLADGPRMTAMAAAAAAAAALIERENSAQGSGGPSASSQSQLDGFARGFQQGYVAAMREALALKSAAPSATDTTAPASDEPRPRGKVKRCRSACIGCRTARMRCVMLPGGACTHCVETDIACVPTVSRKRGPHQRVDKAAGRKMVRSLVDDPLASLVTGSLHPHFPMLQHQMSASDMLHFAANPASAGGGGGMLHGQARANLAQPLNPCGPSPAVALSLAGTLFPGGDGYAPAPGLPPGVPLGMARSLAPAASYSPAAMRMGGGAPHCGPLGFGPHIPLGPMGSATGMELSLAGHPYFSAGVVDGGHPGPFLSGIGQAQATAHARAGLAPCMGFDHAMAQYGRPPLMAASDAFARMVGGMGVGGMGSGSGSGCSGGVGGSGCDVSGLMFLSSDARAASMGMGFPPHPPGYLVPPATSYWTDSPAISNSNSSSGCHRLHGLRAAPGLAPALTFGPAPMPVPGQAPISASTQNPAPTFGPAPASAFGSIRASAAESAPAVVPPGDGAEASA